MGGAWPKFPMGFRQWICLLNGLAPSLELIMAQHFLKSAAFRNFTTYDVAQMSEQECFEYFVESRWLDWSTVTCPHCGEISRHYYRKSRRQWRCKGCSGYFSVTTGTPFQSRKLPFKKLLFGIVLFINGKNGISFHRLSSELAVNVKTAQAFVGKLREAIYGARKLCPLKGVVQIDGGHFGGRPRHGRLRRRSKESVRGVVEARVTGRKQRHKGTSMQNLRRLKKRRIVFTLREICPEKGNGATRTITAIGHAENEANAVTLARAFVEPGSIIMTDENPAYNQLGRWYDHRTVPHAEMFSTEDGVNDNQAESYFSRLRRYVLGVAHRIEPKYLGDIAAEMAWREDTRRFSQREIITDLLSVTFKHGLSKWWRGYWQGANRPGEMLWQVIER